jgi:hypothetical protein
LFPFQQRKQFVFLHFKTAFEELQSIVLYYWQTDNLLLPLQKPLWVAEIGSKFSRASFGLTNVHSGNFTF